MKKGWPRLLKNVTDDLTGDGIRRQITIYCFVTCYACMTTSVTDHRSSVGPRYLDMHEVRRRGVVHGLLYSSFKPSAILRLVRNRQDPNRTDKPRRHPQETTRGLGPREYQGSATRQATNLTGPSYEDYR
jgi:hypothetical protein